MLLHLSDNKLTSYRSKEGFFEGQYIKKKGLGLLGERRKKEE